jgi:DNA-binding CsgD family transcriptional regulator
VELHGRDAERTAIRSALDAARSGLSGCLVVRGEAGIGKTALLDDAVAGAADLQVLRVSGVQHEAGFAYGVLHRLLVPMLGSFDGLPATQRAALEVACGLADGPPADVHVVGLATLSVFAETAAVRPLLVCIDDAQWVDRESLGALAVVGRRIFADRLALVFAMRDTDGDVPELAALPAYRLEGLDHESALRVLRAAVDGPIAAAVGERVVVATAGNPLALTDLGAVLAADPGTAATLLSEPVPIGSRLVAHYLERVRALPVPTQQWLLLAATEPGGDLGYVESAARAIEIPADASAAAEAAGIVALRARIEFRHPLVQSAIYGGATASERRSAHAALANVTTRGRDADRRAMHAASASPGPDEVLAAALEAAADRALARGGFAARTEFLARAAALTPDDGNRARRILAAAHAALTAGMIVQARAFLNDVDIDALDDAGRAAARRRTAELDIVEGKANGFGTQAAAQVAAAQLLAATRRDLTIDALCKACEAALNGKHLTVGTSSGEIAQAIVALDLDDGSSSLDELLLLAFARWMLDGYEGGVPYVRRAVAAMLAPETPERSVLARFTLATAFCTATWDVRSRAAVLERSDRIARSIGALNDLDVITFCRVMNRTDDGHLDLAERALSEMTQIRSVLGATDSQWEIYRFPELLALRAQEPNLPETLRGVADAAEMLGSGAMVSICNNALALYELGHCNYDAAFAGAERAFGIDPFGVDSRGLPNLIEAAVRSNRNGVAQSAFESFESRALGAETPWALGLLETARALVGVDDDVEQHFEAGISLLRDCEQRTDLARAHLLYGEWLRREKRKTDAREQLRTAHTMFADIGAAAFAERARVELAATGERARARSVETQHDLTPQEQQIARLAAAGETNAEIAARLYISARTVDYHLRKVYRKLEVSSRRELRRFYPAS